MARSLSDVHQFNIAPQDMGKALVSLSEQSGISLFFPYEDVSHFHSQGVHGSFSTDEALRRVVAGSGLKVIRTGDMSVTITPARTVAVNKIRYQRDTQFTGTSAVVMDGEEAGASDDAPAPSAAPAASAPSDPAEDQTQDVIIVTGTRQTARTVAESLAPIDVLSAADLQTSGRLSTRDLLGTLVPSINVSNGGAGSSFAVKTLSLRGLSGDQLLVLVNGKRRHNTADLFINGSTQNGQSPPDLDLIPGNAIDHIEVLRDGASAQYGSDAIAGVVNVILKSDIAGAGSVLGGGLKDGGGQQSRVQFDHGIALGEGTLHLALDAYYQGRAIRGTKYLASFYAKLPNGDPDPREATVNRYVQKIGSPQVRGLNLSYDLKLPIGGSSEFYSFSTFSKRHADAYLTFRTPDASNNIPEIFPDGYIPHLHIYDTDFQAAAGARGDMFGGIHYDLSTTYAENHTKFRESTALNVSLGPASPTDFYIGTLRNSQWTTNLDLSKSIEDGLAGPLLIALGAEYRNDGFTIEAGEPASYIDGGYVSTTGPNAGKLRTSGSQGVTGFPPDAAGDFSRHNWSVYIDLEQKIIDGLEVAIAGRHEDYSDFGTTDTGKLSARLEPIKGFAIRGTLSSGFRAPTLQQEHYASSSTIGVVVNGVSQLLPVQALPVDSPAAIALGATPLKPERSTNYSLGLVLTPISRLNVTIDAYQIDIKDRILLSGTLSGPTVLQVLADAGITNSAGGFYFSNAADTRTRGLDIVGTYRADLGSWGKATFGLSANFNDTKFTHIDQVPQELADAGLVLINRQRQGDFTKGTPHDKFIASVNWTNGPAAVNLRATRYGEVTQVGATAATDDVIDPKVLFDLDVSYDLVETLKLTLGANNLFNIYPNVLKPANQFGGIIYYNQYSPYGTVGGFYYAKLSLKF